MNASCGDNVEAKMVYIMIKDGVWSSNDFLVTEIPFFLTPPVIKKKPVFCNRTERENFKNAAFNFILDSVTRACTGTDLHRAWLVFFLVIFFS